MKHLLILIFFFLSVTWSSAQNLEKALQYFNAEKYSEAAKEFVNALPEIEKTYGANDTSFYSKCIIWTGLSYERSKKLDKAEMQYLKVKAIYERINATQNDKYIYVMNVLAKLYYKIGNYTAAEPLFKRVQEIIKKVSGSNNPDYATSLDNLATLYDNIGNYTKAELIYSESLSISKKIYGENHINYAQSLNNLATAYTNLGNYDKAEPLYVTAINIYKKTQSENRPDYAISLNNLATLYDRMGNYLKAESIYLEALTIRKKTFGENHPIYATSLNNLATLYDKIGYYTKAESLYLVALGIDKKTLGTNHPDYAISLNNLATLYDKMGYYTKAESLYIEILTLNKKTLGINHPNYATSLNNLAVLYDRIGNDSKSEPLYIESMGIRKKIFGEKNLDYASSLNNLGTFYNKKGNYLKAEPMLIEATAIYKLKLGENHPDYATSLHNLAMLYKAIGNYEKAEPLFMESLSIREKTQGLDHPDYAKSISNITDLYVRMGFYTKAEPLLLRVTDIYKKRLGVNHPDYARSLNDLATLYDKMGNYTKAEPLYITALNIYLKTLGINHPDYATSLSNLAGLYTNIGNYSKAESTYIEELTIRKNTQGENHSSYATSLNNFALFYEKIGNYAKAEPMLIEATNILKKTLGENHPDYATSLSSLSFLYDNMGEYEKEVTPLLQAFEIRKKNLGVNHPDYARSLNSIAGFYQQMNDYAKAEPLYLEALTILKKVYSENHPDYVTSLNDLALLYSKMGNYSAAEPLYNQVTQIFKKIYGENHPDYSQLLTNQAMLYNELGNYSKAESLMIQSNLNLNNQIQHNFGFMSETEKELFLKTVEPSFEVYNSFALKNRNNLPEFVSLCYNNELAHKGMVLQSGIAIRKTIMNSGDTALMNTFNRFLSLKQLIGKLYTNNTSLEKTKLYENFADELEKNLNQRTNNLKEFQRFLNLTRTSWRGVQSALSSDEVAIEFVSFQYRDEKRWTDSIYYCALLLRKDYTNPKMVYLCEESQLKKALDYIGDASSTINDSYDTHGVKLQNKEKGNISQNQKLYNLIWGALESELKNIHHVYLAPSGLLNRISFMALPIGNKQCLSDKYEVNVVTTTSNIINKQLVSSPSSIAIYGGIIYDMDTTEMVKRSKVYYLPEEQRYSNRGFRLIYGYEKQSESWGYLSGTMDEAEKIHNLFNKKDVKTILYTGKDGSEESLKKLSEHNPYVLHIATHGFFIEQEKQSVSELNNSRFSKKKNIFKTSTNPLMRCGILMSGCNNAWNNKSLPKSIEDGILSGYEVSQTYLGKVKLVVLSACQTGLGDIKGSEGVFGMQRAFKMAGVDFLIVSLWSVPDEQTVELMDLFYTSWLSGKEIRKAFGDAQSKMRKKYPPYYWAAFVLIN
ncbi:MAG: tetratricopeptide repeat protein [Tenuifilaceae bacterium]